MVKNGEKDNSTPTSAVSLLKLPPGVKLLHTIDGHNASVWALAFDAQGHTLASGSFDTTVKLWETGSGNLLRTLEGHEHPVLGLAFDPGGQRLASGSWDKTIKLWDVASGRLISSA